MSAIDNRGNPFLFASLGLDSELLRSVLESLDESVIVQEEGGRIVYANDAAWRRMGLDSGESLLGLTTEEAGSAIEALNERGDVISWRSMPAAQVLAGEPAAEAVVRWRSKATGEESWTLVKARALSSAAAAFAVSFLYDITGLKRAELATRARARRQEEVARLGLSALAGAGLQELFEKSVASVSETLGAEYCAVLELLPGGRELVPRAAAGWPEEMVGERVDMEANSQAAYTLKSSGPVVVEDFREETRFQVLPLPGDPGVVSGMSVVIGGQKGPFGVLCTYAKRKVRFSDDDVHFLQSVANVLATAVQRTRQEDEIGLQSSLLNAVGQAVVATDLRGRVTYWNAAAEELSGWPREEAIGRIVSELTPLEPAGANSPDARERILAGETWSGEFRIRRQDGSSFPALVELSPIRAENGRVTGLIAVTIDISERKRIEQQLILQYQLTRLLSESTGLNEVREPVLRLMCEGLEWDAGAWWAMDEATLRCNAFWRRPEVDLPNFEAETRNTPLDDGVGLPGVVHQTREPAWREEIGEDANVVRAAAAAGDGLHSSFALPIRVGEDVLGVVEFVSRTRRKPEEDLLRVAATIGGQLGHFIERSRAQAALRESEERYRDLVEHSPEPIGVHQEGRWVFLNPAAASLFGAQTPEELIGKPVLDFIHQEYRPLVIERIRHVLEEGRTAELIEEKFVRLDGQIVDVEVFGMPARFYGRPAYEIMARDITEKKRAEVARGQADERFSRLFENAVFGVFQTTPDGRFVSANKALAEMFGYGSPEELQASVTDIGSQLHADPTRREELVRLLEQEGSVSGFEARGRRRDGSEAYISLSGRAVRDAEGNVASFEGIIEDVTPRKMAEEQLREQKHVLETIEQVGATLASELDLSKTAQAVTDAATELTGARFGAFFYDAGDDSGEHFSLYTLSLADQSRFDGFPIASDSALLDATFHGFGIVRSDDISQDPRYEGAGQGTSGATGRPPVRSYLAMPVISRSGEVIGGLFFGHERPGMFNEHHEALAAGIARWAGIAVDNARLYNEAQRTQEQLREANESKDEFLGLVSHELRTPITTIYGGARLMQSRADKLDQQRKEEILADIEQESERLYRLVEDLLTLARLELGASVAVRPVLLQRVVEKMLAAFTKRRPSRQVEVHLEADLAPILADETYVEQVLRNLVGNADKYSPPDEPIVVSARMSGDEVTVRIEDRGPGLSPEEVERIFERFYRSEKTARQASGLGIGLTVCRRLVEAQSGRIWAEARPGGGLAMNFTLPVAGEEGPAG